MISCPSHITLVFRRAGLEKAFENGHGSLQVIFSGRCPSLGLSGCPSRVWGPPGSVGVRPAAVVHAKLRPDDSESETDSPPLLLLLPEKSALALQRKQRTRTLQISSEYRSLETDSARHGVHQG